MEDKIADQILEDILKLKAQMHVDTEPRYRRVEFAGVSIIAEQHMVPAGTAFVSDDVMCRLIDLMDKMGATETIIDE